MIERRAEAEHGRRLGHPISFDHAHAQAPEARDGGGRKRRASRNEKAQPPTGQLALEQPAHRPGDHFIQSASQEALSDRLLHPLEHRVIELGHAYQDRHAVAAHHVRQIGVIVRVDECGPLPERRVEHRQPKAVIPRRDRQDHILRIDIQSFKDGAQVRCDILMSEHDGFCVSRRARGAEHHGHVFGRDCADWRSFVTQECVPTMFFRVQIDDETPWAGAFPPWYQVSRGDHAHHVAGLKQTLDLAGFK